MAQESSPLTPPYTELATTAELRGKLARPRRLPLWLEPYVLLITRKPLAAFGLAVMAVMTLVAIFAEVITPYDPIVISQPDKLLSPSFAHPLGTDHLGRDLFARIVHGARISLTIGFGVVLLGTMLAGVIGCVTGYAGGKLDAIVQRFVDAVMSMPQLILLLTIVSVIGPGILNLVLVLSFRAAIGESRTIRSAVIGIKENQYIEAARAVGCDHLYILSRYILPNIMAPLIVLASVSLASAILAEASLSFLGFGVPPPIPTWGGLLSSEGRRFMMVAPWIAIAPGVALSLVIFGINMLGDGLRDVLDPRLRGTQG
ncbi:MAG: ABC transporter permease [Chloroflexi bacterium]|nr:ABC transporter permease [Chloroflexota bacterium]